MAVLHMEFFFECSTRYLPSERREEKFYMMQAAMYNFVYHTVEPPVATTSSESPVLQNTKSS